MRDTSSPSRTAEVVCLMRASDRRRPPPTRILDDPYATMFLGPLMRAALATLEATGRLGRRTEELSPGLIAYVLTRHRYIDERMVAALDDGAEQVVLLGAGYDTRAYRFADQLGERPVFEVDHPSTSGRKARIVSDQRSELPDANVTRVQIDFQTQSLAEQLAASGFEPGRRTFWVWEGVSMYLSRSAVKATMGTIRELSAPSSELCMDYWYLVDQPDVISTTLRLSPQLLALLGEPVTFGIHPEDVGDFLRRQGLEVLDVADSDELERRYVQDDRNVYPAIFCAHIQVPD